MMLYGKEIKLTQFTDSPCVNCDRFVLVSVTGSCVNSYHTRFRVAASCTRTRFGRVYILRR